ncbi:MAG: beta-galactosidase [Clostridiales bacterium]|nr:beta-galactosidase [Clostridiales bacterium]
MSDLVFRQVHLDFHTSEKIPEVGHKFNKKQFQEALLAGEVESITLFSKCHHGYSYFASQVNPIHPGLSFDLLDAQIEACREIGVHTPIYHSAGFDERRAFLHPEWLNVRKPNASPDFLNVARYHMLCFNTPYLDCLCDETEEIMQRYNPEAVFFDISDVRVCYCTRCISSMREKGLDPRRLKDVVLHGELVYKNYCERLESVVRKYNPHTRIYHNAGNTRRGRRDIVGYNTHLELESLPTGGWGYDHFPMSAAYARTLGKAYLGMTGKFHNTWGEFGGYKHPNALRYETSLCLAMGARCSVGDQLHPSGEMCMATYRLIGKAYSEVKEKERWCKDVEAISDIAVLSIQATSELYISDRNPPADVGVTRMLLEGNYLFDIIDLESRFEDYCLLILPDGIKIDNELCKRIEDYLAHGGRVLASGDSGLNTARDAFAIDFGVRFEGDGAFCPTYMVPEEKLPMTNGVAAYVMYEPVRTVTLSGGECVAWVAEPYFNRTPDHFMSHQHAPHREITTPGAVVTDKTAYIAWDIFTDYAKSGSLHLKELCTVLIEHLISDSVTMRVNLPDRGVATLMRGDRNYVVHLLFAHTTLRGAKTEVIESIVPLSDIQVQLKLPERVTRVYFAPQMRDIPFTIAEGILSFTVEQFELHQMIVIDFETPPHEN